jgi:GAF domain-containing protein
MYRAESPQNWTAGEARALLSFWDAVDQQIEVEQIAALTLQAVRQFRDVDVARLSLIEFATASLNPCWSFPARIDDDALREEVDRVTIDVLRTREPRSREVLAANEERRFVMCVPIVAQSRVIGLLTLSSRQPFSDRDQALLAELAAESGSAVLRARRFDAFRDISLATARFGRMQRELDQVFRALHKRGFEFATISAVDQFGGVIETIRGMNVPPEWMKRAAHGLNSNDIQAHVVRNRELVVIEGYDERFDPDIYNRFGHERLVRVCVPLDTDDEVVGTVEAGCDRTRKEDVFTRENILAVQSIAKEYSSVVAQARPHALLKLITNHTIEVLGADSGSLHVYKDGRQFLVAGVGKAGTGFLQRFAPRRGGMGHRAMATREVQIASAEQLVAGHPELFREGVRAMLAVPLLLEPPLTGVLFIHFWQPHVFATSEIEIAKLLARHLEVTVQNCELMREAVETRERAWTFARFQNVMQELASDFDLTDLLEKIGDYILFALGADNVTLYQYFEREHRFEFPPVMKGSFRDPASMQTQVRPDDIVWTTVQQPDASFADDVASDSTRCGPRRDGSTTPRFATREGVKSSAALALRCEGETFGAMFVNYRSEHRFDVEEKQAINALASSAAIAIKTARLRAGTERQARRRMDALIASKAVLDQVALYKGDVEEQVFELFLRKAVEIVAAPVGVIMWYTPGRNRLESRALRGFPPEHPVIVQKLSEGIVGLAARTRASVLVSDVTDERWRSIYRRLVPDTRSELAVPLTDETGVLGVLNVEHPEAGKFTEEDQALLESLAGQAASAVRSARLYARLERQVQPLQFLGLIATRAHGDLATRLRLLLTGITARQGLGFSRAMVFLLDAAETQLQGRLAIGATDAAEARRFWGSVDKLERELIAQRADIPRALLDLVDSASADIREGRVADSRLSARVQTVSIPFNDSRSAIARCVRERRTVVVEPDVSDPLRTALGEEHASRCFACVPIWTDDHAIGAIVVDNAFLRSEKSVDQEAIKNLDAFAEIAGISVAEFRLQRLQQWRPFMDRIGQLYGSHIAVISALVGKLRNSLSDQQFAELTTGVAEMQRLLTDFRRFSKSDAPAFEPLDLRHVVKSTVGALKASVVVPIETTITGDPLPIRGDARMLGDVIAELVENAEEAMLHAGTPNQIIRISAELRRSAAAPPLAQLDVIDAGPGIAEDDKEKIFQPLFTTKERGSGLGLMGVWDIVQRHEGFIAEVGRPGKGAHFRVRFPLV